VCVYSVLAYCPTKQPEFFVSPPTSWILFWAFLVKYIELGKTKFRTNLDKALTQLRRKFGHVVTEFPCKISQLLVSG
jgi:hypothetical protein